MGKAVLGTTVLVAFTSATVLYGSATLTDGIFQLAAVALLFGWTVAFVVADGTGGLGALR